MLNSAYFMIIIILALNVCMFTLGPIKMMLCYVMLCYVMLCYVMLCYVMLCYFMLML